MSRPELQWKLDEWRLKLPSCYELISSNYENEFEELERNNTFRFRLVLSIHYHRAVILLNAPLLMLTLINVVNDTDRRDSFEAFMDHIIPIVASSYENARHLLYAINIASRATDSLLDQNNAWWLCNYSGMSRIRS